MLDLVASEFFGAVGAEGAAVQRQVRVHAVRVLGHVVVIATVVLGGDWVALEHGVELGGAL